MNSKVKLKEEVDFCLACREKWREVINVSHRANYSSVTETSSHLLSLPAPFFHCVAIGYSMFSHGSLNRALDMKSPPPLNLGSEGLRGDTTSQSAGVTRANHSSAVSELHAALRVHCGAFHLSRGLTVNLIVVWAKPPADVCTIYASRSPYRIKIDIFGLTISVSLFISGESCTRACTAAARWWPWARQGCWVTLWEDTCSRPLEHLVHTLILLSSGKMC